MRNFAAILFFFILLSASAGAQDFGFAAPQIVMEVSWAETGGEIFYRLGDCEIRRPIAFAPGQDVWEGYSGEVVTIADPADLENKMLCPFAIVMGDSVYYLTVDQSGFYRYCEERYLSILPITTTN